MLTHQLTEVNRSTRWLGEDNCSRQVTQAIGNRRTSRGTFSRITAGGEVGINQAVKLDVNFRLPVNTLLEYGMEIKSLWDRAQ